MTGTKTIVSFLLDRTGSMEAVRDDTIGAFNTYAATLEKDAGDLIEFTLVLFDSTSVDKLCVGVAMKDVPRLNRDNYIPRDMTPLIDAACKIIKATEDQLAKRTDSPKVVVCIQTDGHENASTEHNPSELRELIRAKRALGWEFNFMGCGIDAYATAQTYGIAHGSTMSYAMANSAQAFAASARNTASYAGGQSVNTRFSATQKAAAGDIFDPGDDADATKVQPAQPAPPPTAKKKPSQAVEDFTLDH